jgi:5'-3' exonuclease
MIDLNAIFERSKERRVFDSDDRILIIDGHNTFIRVISSVAALNIDGMNVGGITGFLRSIGSNIRDFNPTRCIVVFDGKGGSTRRKSIYPG